MFSRAWILLSHYSTHTYSRRQGFKPKQSFTISLEEPGCKLMKKTQKQFFAEIYMQYNAAWGQNAATEGWVLHQWLPTPGSKRTLSKTSILCLNYGLSQRVVHSLGGVSKHSHGPCGNLQPLITSLLALNTGAPEVIDSDWAQLTFPTKHKSLSVSKMQIN